jgi:hypothetical protein
MSNIHEHKMIELNHDSINYSDGYRYICSECAKVVESFEE